MNGLVAIGECMVELWDDPDAEVATQPSYGGDVLNTLVAAARLGTPTRFITRVGDDAWTPWLLQAWHTEGIDVHAQRLADHRNGVYTIRVQPGGERQFTYHRQGSAASTLAPGDLQSGWWQNMGVLHLSGIAQAISASARATALAAARTARNHGVRVSYDLNFRPRLWSAEGARAAFEELVPFLSIALPSLGDETSALWGSTDPQTIIHLLWERGIELVCAKDGANGVWIGQRQPGTITHVPALPNVRVVDTTAAGDAFNGGLLHGLLAGMDPCTAARLGTVVAGLAVARRGAVASLPWAADVWTVFDAMQRRQVAA